MKNLHAEKITAVILGGNLDFGRCTLASQLPTALWPVGEKPALQHLLDDLQHQGVNDATICANGHSPMFKQAITAPGSMTVTFLDEPLLLGTAGCIREAAKRSPARLYLVLYANTISPPNIKAILDTHRQTGAAVTIMVSLKPEDESEYEPVPQAYLCDSSVLEYIPQEGYFDIKEGLIPLMVKDRNVIRAVPLSKTTGIFRTRTEYLNSIHSYFNDHPNPKKPDDLSNITIDPGAFVDPECRLYGPIHVMKGAVVSKGAIIFGPSIIGRDAVIGANTLLTNSVLWDRCRIGHHCEVQSTVVGYDAEVQNYKVVQDKAVVRRPNKLLTGLSGIKVLADGVGSVWSKLDDNPFVRHLKTAVTSFRGLTQRQKRIFQQGFFVSLLIVFFIWSYWPEVKDLWKIWQRSDEYSGGMIVPFLAVYVLWARRNKLLQISPSFCLWGLVFFGVAQAIRYFGLFFMYSSAERLSLVLSIASIVLLIFGWQIFRRATPILLFLFLMLPFPKSIDTAITLPLQNLATRTAVFFLELLGYAVIREGNIIHVNDTYVAVAEACNGLRMVTSFFIIITMVALLINRSWWEKLILIVSGIPIALLCNSIRLTLTSIAFTLPSLKNWEQGFHDFGGYAMMPLALIFVVLELWLLKKIIITPQQV